MKINSKPKTAFTIHRLYRKFPLLRYPASPSIHVVIATTTTTCWILNSTHSSFLSRECSRKIFPAFPYQTFLLFLPKIKHTIHQLTNTSRGSSFNCPHISLSRRDCFTQFVEIVIIVLFLKTHILSLLFCCFPNTNFPLSSRATFPLTSTNNRSPKSLWEWVEMWRRKTTCKNSDFLVFTTRSQQRKFSDFPFSWMRDPISVGVTGKRVNTRVRGEWKASEKKEKIKFSPSEVQSHTRTGRRKFSDNFHQNDFDLSAQFKAQGSSKVEKVQIVLRVCTSAWRVCVRECVTSD